MRYHQIAMAFQIFSSAFSEGEWIPSLHSCHGADLSPSLEWSGSPAETMSFALVVDDPDAPAGIWCHWLLYDISAKVHNLAQGSKPGTLGVDGKNDFGKLGYNGPCPPRGSPHRYYFRLYALNMHTLGLAAGARRAEVLAALKGHILAQSEYVGRFQAK